MLGLSTSIAASKTIRNMHQQNYLTFNGTDEYIDIDNIAGQVDARTFSVSAWFKIPTTSTTRAIFKCMVGSDSNNQILLQYHAGGNELRGQTKYGGTADVLNQGSNSIENDGNWHHAVLVCDKLGSDNSILYVDSTAKETIAGVGTLSGTLSKASIGNNTDGGAFWLGDLDEIAIWNRAITADEVTAIYNAGVSKDPVDITGGYKESLIAYYRSEEKGGTVAFNYADPSRNGTITNAPTVNSH